MLDDHKKFIDQVINKAAKQQSFNKNKKERNELEETTIESLMEVTGLKRLEVKKLMEKTRKEQLEKQNKNTIISKYRSTAIILIVVTGLIISGYLFLT